ncbi:hypothetical protein [Streptomyces chumphonensis]|uniref:hypothetical protein n=1 Tax=Streptomyces chumphonensis TaxID=1214925 RepID=UPI003D76096B
MAIPGNFLSETTSSIDPNTSGWRPRLNCTVGLGTGGRVGDGCLAVNPLAASEAQAETVSTYPVLAGELYQCFADSSGQEVERIGIEWLDAAGAQVGLTWSLATDSASASWHRVGVAGQCPVGATRARLVLSATPGGALPTHYWENVYLGLPHRTTGNLLSFNVESGGEWTTDGWTAETNGTVGRSVPVASWSADYYLSGGHVMTLTATGAGDTSMVCTERPSAQPGLEYLAYAFLAPPATAADAWIELRFYDAADALLSAVRGPLDPTTTTFQRQRASGVAPTGTASASVAVGMDGASGGQVLRVEGVVALASPVLISGSVVRYADASFEQGVGSWQVVSGPAVLARTSPWGAAHITGSYALHIASATTGTTVIRTGRMPLGEGIEDWRLQFSEEAAVGSWTWTRRVLWYDDGGALLGTSSSDTSPVPSPDWWSTTTSITAPAGAVEAEIEAELVPGAAGAELYVDRVALWRAVPLSEITAHTETASVTVVLRELDVGEFVSLYRVGADGQRSLVRGPDGLMDRVLLEQDLLVVEDYEAPLGVPVRYVADFTDESGADVGERRTDTVTIDPGDVNLAWLKDVILPHRNAQVVVQRAPDWARPIEQGVYRVRGRRNAVVHADVRGGLEGPLSVWTRSDEERAALHWLLDSGHTLLWQAAPGMGVEDVYVQVGEVTEARVSGFASEAWRVWTLPLTQVDMPAAAGVAGTAGRSWRDVLATHDTWQEVMDRYATWEDVLLDRPIGGEG